MSDRASQRSIAISEALGIQDQSTTKQVEAIAQLRRAVEALRGGLLSFTETGCPCSDCTRARAILAEIDGKEPTDTALGGRDA